MTSPSNPGSCGSLVCSTNFWNATGAAMRLKETNWERRHGHWRQSLPNRDAFSRSEEHFIAILNIECVEESILILYRRDAALSKRYTSVRITCPSATFVAISRGCDNVIRPKRCKWTSWFRVVTGRHLRAGDFCIGSQATCAIVARHVATNLHTNRE